MKKIFCMLLPAVLCAFLSTAQEKQDTEHPQGEIILHTATGDVYGQIDMPENAGKKKVPLVLFIAGSGPTDRDGNVTAMMMNSNAYKILADSLKRYGIASLRYDKRGIGASKEAMKSEKDIRFDYYVSDVKGLLEMARKDKRFSEIIILGHSEGSLIGMSAINRAEKKKNADGFISLAGAGSPADQILRRQLSEQIKPPFIDTIYTILDSLKAGKTVTNIHGQMMKMFRPDVQPYLISWFNYNPSAEIAKLKVPVLIIQGTTDLQVTKEDAQQLADANKDAKLILVDNMNHVLKDAPMDREQNIAAYMDPSMPVKTELVQAITDFVKKIK